MIILDSSFLIAFHNTLDVHHEAATDVMDRLLDGEWGKGLLLEYVFLEVTTVLAARRGLAASRKVGDVFLAASELDFVPCSEIFRDTFVTFCHVGGGKLSFADAAIVTVARLRHVPRVATFDTDFRDIEGVWPLPE